MVALAKRPRAEVAIGGASKFAVLLGRIAPPVMRRINAPALHRGFLAPEPGPVTDGAVFEPVEDGRAISGGWRKGPNNGGAPSILLGTVALAAGLLLWRSRRATSY